MKPIYQTQSRSNRLWLIPVLLVVAGIGLFAVRKVFAQQGAADAKQAALDRALRELVALKEQLRQSAAAPAKPAAKPAWEFKVVTGGNEMALNQVLAEGYLWVTTVAPSTGEIVTIFKRRKPAAEKATAQVERTFDAGRIGTVNQIAPVVQDVEQKTPRVDTVPIDDTAVGLKPAAVVATKWEYTMHGGSLVDYKKRMNALGAEGWELVAVNSEGGQPIAFYKRPAGNAEKPLPVPGTGPATGGLPKTVPVPETPK